MEAFERGFIKQATTLGITKVAAECLYKEAFGLPNPMQWARNKLTNLDDNLGLASSHIMNTMPIHTMHAASSIFKTPQGQPTINPLKMNWGRFGGAYDESKQLGDATEASSYMKQMGHLNSQGDANGALEASHHVGQLTQNLPNQQSQYFGNQLQNFRNTNIARDAEAAQTNHNLVQTHKNVQQVADSPLSQQPRPYMQPENQFMAPQPPRIPTPTGFNPLD